MKRGLTAYVAALALAGCTAGADAPGDSALPGGESRTAWSGIGTSEALHFTGTEPFWGGSASGTTLTWKTPERPAGVTIQVTRFAGRGGLGLAGTLDGAPFDMAVSEAGCSDGMSDRAYPFSVTVRRGSETLRGCGWSDGRRFTAPLVP